ncbi:MAG: acyl-CoA dehydrogenase, partial [Sphingomonas bacterium]|uniref:acyl-CoA dehydrogenase family protein n=1 Tax=Sphingomonas bacterium TaxID=1895847 RepID=UPI002632A18D
MPLYLNDEQTMLRDTTRDFVAEHAPVSHMRKLRDANDATGFSRDLWKSFAEMGFTGILIGEDDGGLGLGHVDAGIVLEEIGRNLSPSPFLATAVAAVEALKGSAQAGRWFPGIIAGETVAALAIDEGAKHRDTARDFVAERAPVAHLRKLRDTADTTGFSRDLWKSFAEMGFTGILIGEAQGGLGLGHVEAGVVLEEIGRNLSPSPFL